MLVAKYCIAKVCDTCYFDFDYMLLTLLSLKLLIMMSRCGDEKI